MLSLVEVVERFIEIFVNFAENIGINISVDVGTGHFFELVPFFRFPEDFFSGGVRKLGNDFCGNKATAVDSISAEFVRLPSTVLFSDVTQTLYISFSTCTFPYCFKLAPNTRIFKSGT